MKSNNINTMKRGSRSLISSTLVMTVGSPSGFGSKSLLRLVSVLVLIFTISVGNAWATDYFSDNFSTATGNSGMSSRTGWESFSNCYNHYGSAVRLGTSSKSGSITKSVMASIGSTPTNIIVRFSAKKWNTDEVGLNVTVSGAGTVTIGNLSTLGKQATTNAAFSWDEKDYYEILVTGATSSTKITFTTSTTLRVLLGNVTISSASDATYRYKLVENAKDIGPGDYLIVYNNTYALNTHYGNPDANTYATYSDISTYYTAGTKSFACNATTEALAYRAFTTTNGYALRRAYTGELLGTTSSSTGSYLRWDRVFNNAAYQNEWTLGVNSIVSVYATSNGIRWYNTSGQYRFAMYGKTAQSEIQLFKKEEVPSASCIEAPLLDDGSSYGDVTATSIPVQCEEGIVLGTGCSVTSYGFCWNTTGDPNIEDDDFYEVGKSIDELTSFHYTITGLESNTTYYIVPYATSSAGTGYGEEAYIVTTPTATPTFGTAAGTYNNDQSVTLSCATASAKIYYTTDGSTPSSSSTLYSSAISITSDNTTIKAIASNSSTANPSAVASATYRLTCSAPSFDISGGTYNVAKDVAITSTTTSASIYYTTDGTTPTSGSTLYTGKVHVDEDMTLQAIAIKSNYTNSSVTSADYEIQLPHTVSFSTGSFNPAVDDVTEESYESGIKLPDGPEPYCSCDGWVFVGWSETEIDDETTAPEMLPSGETWKPDANCTLYAVYRKTTTGTSTATFAANDDGTNLEESSYWTRQWRHKGSGCEIWLSDGQKYTSGTPNTWTINKGTSKYADIFAYRKIKKVEVTLSGSDYKIDHVWSDNDPEESRATSLATDGTSQVVTCEGIVDGDVTNVALFATSSNQLRMTTFTITYYNGKFTSNPHTSEYSFHWGTDGQSNWTATCFQQVDDGNEWIVEDYTIPSTTHFYVGYQGEAKTSGDLGSGGSSSATVAWSADPTKGGGSVWQGQMHLVPYNTSANDIQNWGVGLATGATGTVNIYDDSADKNLFVGFEPDGYGITFGGNSYAFGDATDHVRETEVVTLPASLSTTYSVGLATATEGTYVDCSHSDNTATFATMAVTDKVDGKIKISMVPNSDWKASTPKFAIWDATHSKWGTSGEFMTKISDDLYEGYVASGTSTIVIARIDPSYANPGWSWNQTVNIGLTTLNTKFTITSKVGGDGADKDKYNVSTSAVTPTASAKGKFRMWDNNSLKNWCTHFIPYYTLTYNKNDESASGSMESQERNSESSTLTVTVQANGFTAPTGKHFNGWKTGASSGDDYAAGDSYTLTADGTLYAQWAWDTYTITYNPGTYGSGSIADGVKTYGVDFTLSSSTFTRTGYTQTGWTIEEGEAKYFDLGDTFEDNEDLELFPVWEAIQTTITLDKNGGGEDGLAYAQYDESTIVVEDATAPTGYHLDGYYTNDATPVKIINAEGELAADDITGYVTDGKWSLDEDEITLYAHWEISSYTLTWDLQGGTVTVAGTGADVDDTGTPYSDVTYGDDITAPTVTKTGYTFSAWSPSVAKTMPAANTTYTATWTINSYNVAVAEVDGVTITATPTGGSAISEGNNANVDYNKSVTLAYSSLETGIYFVGWKVTNAGGDDVTTTVVSSNTLTVPAYAVTVTAVLGKMKAWCMPEFEVTGDIHLTSYNGVYVNSTSTTGDLLTVSGTNTENVTKISIDYLDNNGDVVATKSSSPLRLYNSAGSSLAESNITTGFSTGTYEGSFSVRFTPTAYDELDNYTLQLKIYKGTRVIKTVEHPMAGRSLPEYFVIASKFNGKWYALPNTIVGNTSAIKPIAITVDNDGTPTAATYAPTTAKYKGGSRYAALSNMYGISLLAPNDSILKVSKNNNYVYVGKQGSSKYQDWYLKSTDLSQYTLLMPTDDSDDNDPENGGPKKMGIVGGNMGYYKSPTAPSAEIYLLPITTEYTDIPATATEWGRYSVILAANPGATATKAQARIEAGSPTEDQMISAINAAMGTAKNVKVPVGSIDLADLANNEGKLLYIDWYNSSSTLLGTSCVTIPRIIAANRNMKTDGEPLKNAWTDKEVHVLPGFTLTANTSDYATNPGTATIKELHIYPGATLNVSTGTLTATTLRLHNGWTRAGEKQYNTARVYINATNHAALAKGTASMDYDIYELTDGKHYYPLAVPFETSVSSIDYADSYLAGFSNYGTTGQYVIKEYDGARRAENGPDQKNNWTPVASDATLQPGHGYIMSAVAVKGEAIIRVPLDYNDAWTADGEKGTANYDEADHTKNVVAVLDYTGTATSGGKKVNEGWNLLGVPFMSCYATGEDMGTSVVMQGKFDFSTGNWTDDKIRYVNVPTHDFSEYIQTDMEEDDPVTELLPGWCFFVQVKSDGNLTFLTADQVEDSDLPIYAPRRENADVPEKKAGIILSDGEASDKTTIIVSDKYHSADYEVGADLEKMFGNGYTLATYSLSGSTRLAYNAMSKSDATAVIPIGYRAPAEGTYTFSINPRYAESGAFSRVDLIDYQTGSLTNLMTSSYTFTTGRTQDDSRFALNVVMKPTITTDVEAVSDEGLEVSGAHKVIIDDKLYIILDGKMYDATGKMVREINK